MAVAKPAFVQRLTAHTRIGLDLEQEPDGPMVVRAVAARGPQVRWQREARLPSDGPLSDALAAFLHTLPARRWPRSDVVVALGPASVQLKRLPGVPPLADPSALNAAVRQNASRFFLRNGIPITTASLRINGPASAWGAAVERPLLDSIATGCQRTRFRLRAIVPAATVLGAALMADAQPVTGQGPAIDTLTPEGTSGPEPRQVATIRWPANAPAADMQTLTYDAGRLVDIRSSRHPTADNPNQVVRSSTSGWLNTERWPFAAAYGAAISGHREPIAWRIRATGTESVPTRRLRIATVCCALAIIAALTAPGVGALIASARATSHLHMVAASRMAAMQTADSLVQMTAALHEAAIFADQRVLMTVLLAGLATALPPRSAVVAFHADSAGGTLVALTPDASVLLTSLERVPGLTAPDSWDPLRRSRCRLR